LVSSDIAAPLLLGFLSLTQLGMILIGFAGFVVAFGLAVFIHELGHFLAAKAFGVPVQRFVIGLDKAAIGWLPPCIVEWKWGETTCGLSIIPLGGYVLMSGVVHPEIERYLEEGESKAAAGTPQTAARPDGPPRPLPAEGTATLGSQAVDETNALYLKPFWQKTIIYGAGVVMNLILAMAVITLLYTRGFNESAPFPAEVSWIEPGSVYEGKGLGIGDIVVTANGTAVKDSEELAAALIPVLRSTEGPWEIALGLKRPDGSRYELPLSLAPDSPARRDFFSTFVRMPPYIEGVIINDAADKAGLRGGDTVTAVNGTPVTNWYQFRAIVRASLGTPLELDVQRPDGSAARMTVTPKESTEERGIGQIGIIPGNSERVLVQEALLVALAKSPGRTYDFTVQYINNLKRLGKNLVGGNINSVRRELGGPVAIAQVAYRQAQKGLNDWLKFLVILNIALAVMNMLPIPVLDGGRICMAAVEAVFRRPVPPKLLIPVMNGAFLFLMVFFVLVTFNDVLKIFL
jgi:regulator of sigma E protease